MEKMTILEMKKGCNLLDWAVINAVTKLGKLENKWLEFPKDGKWEMKLIMSGVELPIFFLTWKKQWKICWKSTRIKSHRS